MELQSTTILTRKEIAVKLMRVLQHGLGNRFTRQAFVSPVPMVFPGGYVMVLSSPLFNKKLEDVGSLRIYIYVPEDKNMSIFVRVEWTRNAFGFWYSYDIRLFGVEDFIVELYSNIRNIVKWFSTTADGTVGLSSMNRMFRKIKKNIVKDKAIKVGMVIG